MSDAWKIGRRIVCRRWLAVCEISVDSVVRSQKSQGCQEFNISAPEAVVCVWSFIVGKDLNVGRQVNLRYGRHGPRGRQGLLPISQPGSGHLLKLQSTGHFPACWVSKIACTDPTDGSILNLYCLLAWSAGTSAAMASRSPSTNSICRFQM